MERTRLGLCGGGANQSRWAQPYGGGVLSVSDLAPRARAQAYDQHLNMILGDVEETVTSVDIDDEPYEETIKARSTCV